MGFFTFEKIEEKHKVSKLEYSEFSKFNRGLYKNFSNYHYNSVGLIELGIYSERIAHFLNFMLNAKRYDLDIISGGFGGGILLNGNVDIVITPFHEVAFKLDVNDENKFSDVIVFKSTAYRSMRGIMNTFFKEYALEKDELLELNDNGYKFEISVEDYEILHAHFGYANYKLKKYTKEQLNNVFGEKFSNQFVISAMEHFKQEIDKLEEARKDAQNGVAEKWSAKRNEIDKAWDAERNQTDKFYDAKIKEINDQVTLLTAQNGFTF